MKIIEKNWKDLDLDKVDFGTDVAGNTQWSFSAGGHPHGSDEWSIYTYTDDETQVRYKLPECINEMMRLQRKCGGDEATRRIRSTLGMNY